jgi:hypothetical protein
MRAAVILSIRIVAALRVDPLPTSGPVRVILKFQPTDVAKPLSQVGFSRGG